MSSLTHYDTDTEEEISDTAGLEPFNHAIPTDSRDYMYPVRLIGAYSK